MIPVIDLFAGPGGLNEGFSSVGEDGGKPIFSTVASFEMDAHAHQTLLLRGVFRRMKRLGLASIAYREFVSGEISWEEFSTSEVIRPILAEVEKEVHQIELGPSNREVADAHIRAALLTPQGSSAPHWVLIGGPPCQAYSLAGRSRRTNDKDFEKDKKHFLYQEYLHIIEEFEPSIFVMENVKGLLSSTHAGSKMFEKILGDLSNPKPGLEYEVRSLSVAGKPTDLRPKDFVVKSEDYGVPQKRHRLILVGVRKDLIAKAGYPTLKASAAVSVRDAIADLPKIRSVISPVGQDSWLAWAGVHREAMALVPHDEKFQGPVGRPKSLTTGAQFISNYTPPEAVTEYQHWVLNKADHGVSLHEARRHMESDLKRYGYLASLAASSGRNPTILNLPPELQPEHMNVGRPDTPFTDRFRVQLWDTPATTVVSHIAKDGHYYIHPDPTQMRSLTVREAARLQSFPDNYFFRGTRTQQYSQVGNAVPPLLARKIALVVAQIFREIELTDEVQFNELEFGEAVLTSSI
jgi:DNA (cytosine-5)-methyltransferase 1